MKTLRKFFPLAAALLAAAAWAADSLNETRARMNDRLPGIVALWKQELVGENNQGFLTVRGQLGPEQRKLVEAENADRAQLYAQLAQRGGLTAEEVGRAQARKIAEKSPRGYWIQDEEGVWEKKE